MPQTIAILGASRDHRKFGNKCVRAYRSAGFQVYPINLRDQEIEGLETYARLDQIQGPLDRISVYLPPSVTRDLLPEIARRGAGEVWFNPGSADQEILQAARETGIEVRDGCSIVDIGLSPSQFP
jgi:predicted CoA-binding protein